MLTQNQVIDLTEYYKINQRCNTCNGPLEIHRDQKCTKCKLKSKVLLFLDIIEGNVKDARMDVKEYMKVRRKFKEDEKIENETQTEGDK